MKGRALARIGLLVLALLVAACRTPPRPVSGTLSAPQVAYVPGQWREMPGWEADAVAQAWPALLASCRAQTRAEWLPVCAAATRLAPATDAAVRAFLESHLQPWRIVRSGGAPREARDTGLLTGYFEPQLRGSRRHLPGFDTPLYSPPDDLLTVDLGSLYPELKGRRVRGRLSGKTVVPYFTRAQLAADPALAGHELVWIDDALDAFLLEVQGSGRVQLDDGTVIRLAYADQNGQPYRAIGRYLVSQGALTVEHADIPGIRAWLAAHPQRLHEVLDANPSVVFFQEQPLGDPQAGPRGAQGVPLREGRSIAVDPAYLPLGTPVYLATTGPAPLQRLVIAQDSGGAISGAPRADLFCGAGESAAALAGTLRAQARFWVLWPRDAAPALPPADRQNSTQILPK